MTDCGEKWAILNTTALREREHFHFLWNENAVFASDIFSDFHARVFVSSTSESQRSKTENTPHKLKSSAVLYWTTSDAFQLPTSRFKGDVRAHAGSCPPDLLRPWWEWRIIKLLTTGEERQEWLDTSPSNSHHLLHSRCNALWCDSDYKGVKPGSHHWTLQSTLRTLLLVNRCGLRQRAVLCPPRLFSYSLWFRFPFFFCWLTDKVSNIRNEKKAHRYLHSREAAWWKCRGQCHLTPQPHLTPLCSYRCPADQHCV